MKVSGNNRGPRPIPEAGLAKARCIAMIDLGTQEREFQGKKSSARKVKLTFELVETAHVFDKEKGPQPFVVSKEYTASLSEKATLHKDLTQWRGKKFTKEELEGYDLNNLVGKPCYLSIVHEQSKKDSNVIYANIASIIPIKPGEKIPANKNPLIRFNIDNLDAPVVFGQLHKFEQEKITKSPEWQKLQGNAGVIEESIEDSHEETEEDVF